MANGDAAAAAGLPTVPSTADRRNGYDEINLTRDLLVTRVFGTAQIPNLNASKITAGVLSTARIPDLDASKITSGKLDLSRLDATSSSGAGNELQLVVRDASGYFGVKPPTSASHPATKDYVDNAGAKADGPTATAYARAATGSGWYSVYMNSALQFMRNTSSRRYKDDVQDASLDLEAILRLRPVTYHRKGQPAGTRELGLIAEEVAETVPHLTTWDVPRKADGTPRKGGKPRPEAVRYEQVLPVMLLAVVQDQARRLAALEAALLEQGRTL